MKRRDFLATSASVGILSTAGCIGSKKQYEGEYGHPSMNESSEQPRLGPKPEETNALIVAFEDPACPSCASFHTGPFQELKQNHIEEGNLTFIYRGIDVIYNWGQYPLQVQEKIYQNQPDKVFDVIDEYYRRQRQISPNNVQEKSREILQDAGLDVEEYTSDLNSYNSAIQTDLSDSRQSRVRGTPTMFLFKDKKYETTVVGPKPATIYESILDL